MRHNIVEKIFILSGCSAIYEYQNYVHTETFKSCRNLQLMICIMYEVFLEYAAWILHILGWERARAAPPHFPPMYPLLAGYIHGALEFVTRLRIRSPAHLL